MALSEVARLRGAQLPPFVGLLLPRVLRCFGDAVREVRAPPRRPRYHPARARAATPAPPRARPRLTPLTAAPRCRVRAQTCHFADSALDQLLRCTDAAHCLRLLASAVAAATGAAAASPAEGEAATAPAAWSSASEAAVLQAAVRALGKQAGRCSGAELLEALPGAMPGLVKVRTDGRTPQRVHGSLTRDACRHSPTTAPTCARP